MRRKGIKFDYPLIVAAGFVGEMCWHGGLSASIAIMLLSGPIFMLAVTFLPV